MLPTRFAPCLALLLSACVGAPVVESASDQKAVMSEPATESATETRFRTPAGYADAIDAVARLDTAHDAVPAVAGLRLGTFAGMPALLVDTPHATAAVALHGGHLLSYVPAGGEDLLWLSPRVAAAPAPIRGGVPVVWPYFGRQGQGDDVPSHGFVRTMRWQLVHAAREADGTMTLALAPPAFAELDLELRMDLRIGATLEQSLTTRNTGAAPVVFSQALHTYFRVSDVHDVHVDGLEGLDFLDKNDGYDVHRQQGPWRLDDARDPGRSDYIYTGAGGRYRLDDPGLGRRIDLQTQGSGTLVVWNPGEASAERSSDMNAGAWRGFVCLEAANAGPGTVRLAPGAQHVLSQRVEVQPLD